MQPSTNTSPTLVVIDDQEDMCEFVVAAAQAAGYSASAVIDAGPWLASEHPPPDVIVLDLMMPGLDGVEVLRELAQLHPSSRLIISSASSARVLDSSMHLAKALGLNIVGQLRKPFQPEQLRELLGQELAVSQPASKARSQPSLQELQRALEENQFVVHFQPLVAFADGRYAGVELLVRWQHPQYGMLRPDSFLPLVESSGLTLPLIQCVLEKGLPECVMLQQHGLDGMFSFNLPPAALTDLTFPEDTMRRRERHGAQGLKIHFEITETTLARDTTVLLDILMRLSLKGFGLSIDDFGTGHSSLSLLHQMPFSVLKIDLSFVRAAETDASARIIVEKSVALGRDLGMTVVAEGVASQALWDWLRGAGCDLAQGYFVSRPLPSAELLSWARSWRARSAFT